MKIKLGLMSAALAVASMGVMAQSAPSASASEDPNGNLIGLSTPNGKLVYDFINLWFNEHKPFDAFDKYVARTGYMNHAVYNATTKTVNKTFEQEKAEEARAAGPTAHFDIKQIIAQGNLVFVHIAATQGAGPAGVGPATGNPPGGAPPNSPPGGPGAAPGGAGPPAAGAGGPGGQSQGDGKGPDEMVMILRVHKGKIVDHWDMHIPTNSDSVVFADMDRKLP